MLLFWPRIVSPRGAALAALFWMGAACAQSEIYQCTDENGKVEYKNTGITKGCKKMTVEPVVVPKLTGPTAKTPTNFPKVDNDTQKSRDSDRRRILEDELKVQEAKLADLEKTFNNGEPERQGDERNYQRYLDRVQQLKDEIARTQSDIDSIKSELSKL
ncbi:MAG: DUF4124 domain-containing protein [Burkholderiaceae bacterium]